MSVPYDAGHYGWRMGRGPLALLDLGLADLLVSMGLEADHVEVSPESDALRSELSTGFSLHRQVRNITRATLEAHAFPLLLAGDCNVSLGVVAGHQQLELHPAFLWCDAHADFHTPNSDTFGSLDSHGLAMLTGRAWTAQCQQNGVRALSDDQVALIGARAIDMAEQEALNRSRIRQLSPGDVRDSEQTGAVLQDLRSSGTSGFHLHLDADVLDPSIAPANDFAAPGGLSAMDIRRLATSSSEDWPLRSMSVASYDPSHDPSYDLGQTLLDSIAAILVRWSAR